MDLYELIKTIEFAFQDVEISEISLAQFLLTDQKGMTGDISYQEWLRAGKARVDSCWQEISDKEVEENGCLLAHMHADEFRYYLPVYMRYSLKNYKKELWESDIIGNTIFALLPSSKDNTINQYIISQFLLLNKGHKAAIVAFLKFIAKHAYYLLRADAIEALENYWDNQLNTG